MYGECTKSCMGSNDLFAVESLPAQFSDCALLGRGINLIPSIWYRLDPILRLPVVDRGPTNTVQTADLRLGLAWGLRLLSTSDQCLQGFGCVIEEIA